MDPPVKPEDDGMEFDFYALRPWRIVKYGYRSENPRREGGDCESWLMTRKKKLLAAHENDGRFGASLQDG